MSAKPRRPAATPRSVAIVNQKGGVAKTTTAVSVAAAEAGLSVLLVDLDPQASATRWLAAEPTTDNAGVPRTVLQVLDGTCTVDEVAVPCVAVGVEVLPATIDLVGAERTLGGEPGAELTLRTALADAKPRDLVLFDCPPTLGLLAVNALVAAREVLVPIRHSVRLSEAPSAHEPITMYDPTSNVAQDYRDATTALLARGAP